jgi:hypothetical protein
VQYFGEQYPILQTNNIFHRKNWVPKNIIGDPSGIPILGRSQFPSLAWYVICVELSMLFQPTFLLLID